jgi:hypothetical protein
MKAPQGAPTAMSAAVRDRLWSVEELIEPMKKTLRVLIMVIYVTLWMLTWLVLTTDAPFGRALIPGAIVGTAIGGVTWYLIRNVSRGLRWLSVAIGLSGLVIASFFTAPIFVDPPTFWAVLIPNLLLLLPSAMLPATLVLVVGAAVKKIRNRNQDTTRNSV